MKTTSEGVRDATPQARRERTIPRPPRRRPDPAPPRDPNYYRGRHVVARGSGAPRPIRFSLEVDLDVEQSTWVHEEAGRTGLDYEDVIKRLIDRERVARR